MTFGPLSISSRQRKGDVTTPRFAAPGEMSMTAQPRRALIVIDVQNEYFTGNLLIEHPPRERSIATIARAIDAAREAHVPVVVVQHTAPTGAPIFDKGKANWQLHPEVARRAHGRPFDHHFEKSAASIFQGTGFADWLAAHQIDTLTIAGYMTHNCDAASVYGAAERGLQVEVLADATGSLPYRNRAGAASAEEIHRAFLVVFHSNFGAVLSTEEWIAALASGQLPERGNIYASNIAVRAVPAT
jgi:nicotinamidase-related amidase